MSMFDPSKLPPPVVTPMMPPSGPIPYMDYVYKNTAHPNDKELRPYTMTTEAYLYEQKEWTEKTIRTREKLEKLQKKIWRDLPNYHERNGIQMNLLIQNTRSGKIYLSVYPPILFTIVLISVTIGFIIGRL